MTDATDAKNNLSDRRLRRSARLTTGSEAAKPAAAQGRTPGNATGKASGGNVIDGKAAPAQKSSAVSRRSRRRRQIGRQVAGTANSVAQPTVAQPTVTQPTRTAGGSRAGRLSDLSNSTEKRRASDTGIQSRISAPIQSKNNQSKNNQHKNKGNRGASSRAASGRSAARRSATAGSVPLSSSLVRRRSRRPKLPKYALSAIWILVGGLGLATIFGTILANRPSGEPNAALTESVMAKDTNSEQFAIPLAQEIPKLKATLEELPTLYPGLKFKAFYVDVDTGDYVDIDGREAIAAASTIKLPILIAFFEEVDKGNIDLNQTLAMLKEQVAEGSGDMQLSSPGTQFTALEVATQMIVNSDNTATNMMIALLGGAEALNQRFDSYGLEETRLSNPLPDIEGSNTTSARDLVQSMLLVQGDTLKMRSRDRVLNILKRTENKRLLAAGLEEKGALTYNKTGFIGKMLGDVALVDLSNGKRYIVSVLVERPDNDGRALELIHSLSGRTYQYTDQAIQPAVTPLGNPDGEVSDRSDNGLPADGSPADGSPTGGSSADDLPADDSSVSDDGGTSTITITQPQSESPATALEDSASEITEDPYPSANP